MTSQMIGSGLSDSPYSPVRAKVKCCKSHDHFGCQIKDCSATRIPSLSITGRHPWPTGSLMGGGGLPLCRGAVSIFYSSSQLGGNPMEKHSTIAVATLNTSCVYICRNHARGSSKHARICLVSKMRSGRET